MKVLHLFFVLFLALPTWAIDGSTTLKIPITVLPYLNREGVASLASLANSEIKNKQPSISQLQICLPGLPSLTNIQECLPIRSLFWDDWDDTVFVTLQIKKQQLVGINIAFESNIQRYLGIMEIIRHETYGPNINSIFRETAKKRHIIEQIDFLSLYVSMKSIEKNFKDEVEELIDNIETKGCSETQIHANIVNADPSYAPNFRELLKFIPPPNISLAQEKSLAKSKVYIVCSKQDTNLLFKAIAAPDFEKIDNSIDKIVSEQIAAAHMLIQEYIEALIAFCTSESSSGKKRLNDLKTIPAKK